MVEGSERIALADYQSAYRRVVAGHERNGFLVNLTAYLIVNTLLASINLLFVPEFIWFVFPLIGWGMGLTAHYVFAVRLMHRFLAADEAKAECLAMS